MHSLYTQSLSGYTLIRLVFLNFSVFFFVFFYRPIAIGKKKSLGFSMYDNCHVYVISESSIRTKLKNSTRMSSLALAHSSYFVCSIQFPIWFRGVFDNFGAHEIERLFNFDLSTNYLELGFNASVIIVQIFFNNNPSNVAAHNWRKETRTIS